MAEADLSPLMRQYRDIKQCHRDAILFFRVGDFYEMFFEDAEIASRALSIALTSRDKHRPDPIPLCGVPHHAAMTYIAKLLKAGHTVALCDQVEDPKMAKGLVRREVVRLYTPGTLTDTELLPATESNFLAAIAASPAASRRPSTPWLALAALEPSTGEFSIMEFTGEAAIRQLQDELFRLEPREVLYPAAASAVLGAVFAASKNMRLCGQEDGVFDAFHTRQILLEHFRTATLDGFGCRDGSPGIQAAGAILHYLRDTRPAANLSHISKLQVRQTQDAMHLDAATIRNLELVRPLMEDRKDATLLSVLDRTVSAMGSRLMREWLLRPLVTPSAINERLDAVAELLQQPEARARLRTALRGVQDLARLAGRVSLHAATPRELLALEQSVSALPTIGGLLSQFTAPILKTLAASWDNLPEVQRAIQDSIRQDAPATARDGGIIKEGFHSDLDELRRAAREGKGWMATLEASERQQTGIDSLKIRFNQVFGYYIEVTKANAGRIPERYVRKQTLTNAERFTTAELKELEDRVMGAESKLIVLELELFEQIQSEVATHTHRVQSVAAAVALLDVLAALSESSALNHYVRPEIAVDGALRILDGRHPVVERLGPAGGFIPNDVALDTDGRRLIVLTGPNRAGKSTYLRQVALTVLMAQVGSFVPARAAHIGIADRIFTRVGASDNLAAGHSTFMVEMTETAHILNCATRRSLILLDEIGRGTSTYDGLSIAWAVAEYALDPSRLGARTLFATHYHEMTDLASQHTGVGNCTVLVKERNDDVIFLRKIVEGAADRSYGIHVARLAGLPRFVIDRAKEVLAQLESVQTAPQSAPSASTDGALPSDPTLDPTLPRPHPIIDEVRQMDLFAMTPLEALNRLADLQRRLDAPGT
jgi:DNA mismatch repair protein MutS